MAQDFVWWRLAGLMVFRRTNSMPKSSGWSAVADVNSGSLFTANSFWQHDLSVICSAVTLSFAKINWSQSKGKFRIGYTWKLCFFRKKKIFMAQVYVLLGLVKKILILYVLFKKKVHLTGSSIWMFFLKWFLWGWLVVGIMEAFKSQDVANTFAVFSGRITSCRLFYIEVTAEECRMLSLLHQKGSALSKACWLGLGKSFPGSQLLPFFFLNLQATA